MIEIVIRRFVSVRAIEKAMAERPAALFIALANGRKSPCGLGRGGVFVEVSRKVLHLALAMIAAPVGLTTEDAVEILYGGRKDGGPEFALTAAYICICDAKVALRALGFDVSSGPRRLGLERPVRLGDSRTHGAGQLI